jgi:predicted transposase YdaD
LYCLILFEFGSAEGIEEGRELGQRSLILRLLNRRVGRISESLTDRIQALRIVKLEILAENLLDFRSLDDLTDWLDGNQ